MLDMDRDSDNFNVAGSRRNDAKGIQLFERRANELTTEQQRLFRAVFMIQLNANVFSIENTLLQVKYIARRSSWPVARSSAAGRFGPRGGRWIDRRGGKNLIRSKNVQLKSYAKVPHSGRPFWTARLREMDWSPRHLAPAGTPDRGSSPRDLKLHTIPRGYRAGIGCRTRNEVGSVSTLALRELRGLDLGSLQAGNSIDPANRRMTY